MFITLVILEQVTYSHKVLSYIFFFLMHSCFNFEWMNKNDIYGWRKEQNFAMRVTKNLFSKKVKVIK